MPPAPLKLFSIVRTAADDYGVWGVFKFNGSPFALTGERPWKNNRVNVSCIPAGFYMVRWRKRANGQWAYEIRGVPGRSGILLHKGTFPLKNSKGCTLVGESFGRKGKETTLDMSGAGYDEFIRLAGPDPEISLEILDPLKITG